MALASLLFHRHHFRGLDANALDLAQLARNVSGGQGFTTGVLRPLLMSDPIGGNSFPEQTHAPLWSFLLGWIFPFAGARDGVVVAFSFFIFLLSAALLYVLALRISGDRATAALATCAYGLAPPALALAGAGQPIVLSTLLLLAMLIVLTPGVLQKDGSVSDAIEEDDLDEPPIADRKLLRTFFLAGALASLCYLTEYVALLAALPLALVWGLKGRRWQKKTVIAFVVGFVLVALPWWVRNARLFGNPLATSQLHELAMNTNSFPGYSAYADPDMAQNVGDRLRPDAKSFVKKIGSALVNYSAQAPYALPLYLFPFVAASIFIAGRARHFARVKSGTFLALVCLCFGLALLGRVASWQLLPLVPLMAILGVCAYRDLSRGAMRSGVLQDGGKKRVESGFEDEAEHGFAPGFRGVLAFALLLLAMLLPPMWSLVSTQAASVPDNAAFWKAVREATPEKRVLITDVPALAAWYAERPAALLPANPELIPTLENRLGNMKTGAVYLSPTSLSQPENAGWARWQRAGGALQNYERAAARGNGNLPGALLVRLLPLDEVLQLARKQPKSAQLQELLGRTRLQANQDKEALAAFLRAGQLQPQWHAPFLGAGRAALRMRNYSLAQRQFSLALGRRAPADAAVQSLMGLGDAFLGSGKRREAAAAYQKVLTLAPQNPTALNNLAYLYTEGGNVDRALEMARRAVAARPSSAPIWDTFGWALLRAGQVRGAIAALQRSVSIAPRSAIAQFHLGVAFAAAKDKRSASKALNLALSIGLPDKERKIAEVLVRR